MKLRPLKQEATPRLMIIPMIDIIFFLLVFFMMSMLSMVVQKTIPLTLPKTAAAKADTTRTVPVSVTREGAVFLEQRPIALEALPAELQALREEESEEKPLVVVLRGDDGAPYGAVVTVMDAVRSGGVTRISIATSGKAGAAP